MPHWPHAPPHYLGGRGVYMVTGGTYGKIHHFSSPERLQFLHDLLLDLAAEFGWQLEAWAVFSNHYHFIGQSPDKDASNLPAFVAKAHAVSARHVNRLDQAQGRKVWHNYRDSQIIDEKSHLARLHYVHGNARHHRLVLKPEHYPWCSAAWFERTETPARVRTVYGFPVDRLLETDEWSPESVPPLSSDL